MGDQDWLLVEVMLAEVNWGIGPQRAGLMSGSVLSQVYDTRRMQSGRLLIHSDSESTLSKLPHLDLPWVSKKCLLKLFELT